MVARVPVAGKVTFEPAAFAFRVVFPPVIERVNALFIPVPPLFDVSTPVTSAVERSMALQAGVAPARRKVFGPPTGSRVPEPAGLIYIISPAVVIGDNASNAAALVEAPVPPLAKATTPVTLVAEVAFPLSAPIKVVALRAPVRGTYLRRELLTNCGKFPVKPDTNVG